MIMILFSLLFAVSAVAGTSVRFVNQTGIDIVADFGAESVVLPAQVPAVDFFTDNSSVNLSGSNFVKSASWSWSAGENVDVYLNQSQAVVVQRSSDSKLFFRGFSYALGLGVSMWGLRLARRSLKGTPSDVL